MNSTSSDTTSISEETATDSFKPIDDGPCPRSTRHNEFEWWHPAKPTADPLLNRTVGVCYQLSAASPDCVVKTRNTIHPGAEDGCTWTYFGCPTHLSGAGEGWKASHAEPVPVAEGTGTINELSRQLLHFPEPEPLSSPDPSSHAGDSLLPLFKEAYRSTDSTRTRAPVSERHQILAPGSHCIGKEEGLISVRSAKERDLFRTQRNVSSGGFPASSGSHRSVSDGGTPPAGETLYTRSGFGGGDGEGGGRRRRASGLGLHVDSAKSSDSRSASTSGHHQLHAFDGLDSPSSRQRPPAKHQYLSDQYVDPSYSHYMGNGGEIHGIQGIEYELHLAHGGGQGHGGCSLLYGISALQRPIGTSCRHTPPPSSHLGLSPSSRDGEAAPYACATLHTLPTVMEVVDDVNGTAFPCKKLSSSHVTPPVPYLVSYGAAAPPSYLVGLRRGGILGLLSRLALVIEMLAAVAARRWRVWGGKARRTGRLLARGGLSEVVFGLEPSPELAAIAIVYFVQGFLNLAALAVSFFLKDNLRLSPAQVSALTGGASLPWVLKPLYGFLSDAVPIFGSRRRSYLIICGAVGVVSWGSLATPGFVTASGGALACLAGGSLSTAFSDVVVDSIVVSRSRGHPQSLAGALQSLCWTCQALGGVLSAYFSGFLVERYGCQFVFALTAMIPLLVCISALFIKEEEELPSTSGASTSAASTSANSQDDGPTSALRGRSLRTSPLSTWADDGSEREKGGGAYGAYVAYDRGEVSFGDGLGPAEVSLRGGGGEEADLEAEEKASLISPTRRAAGRARAINSHLTTPLTAAAVSQHGGGRRSAWVTVVAQARILGVTLMRRDVLLPALFIFVWQSAPSSDSAMFYFYTNKLKFSPEWLGTVKLAGALASLTGTLAFNAFLKHVPPRRLMTWILFVGAALSSSQLLLVSGISHRMGIPDKIFVLGDNVVLSALGKISMMPILVLAARLCPAGVEATLFATLMSIFNAGGFAGATGGAVLTAALGVTATDFSRMTRLVATCVVLSLIPAPFLFLLPSQRLLDEEPPSDDEEEGDGARGGDGQLHNDGDDEEDWDEQDSRNRHVV